MIDTCFTYGSLMCADIMADVAGLALAGEPARLDGYARHPVLDEEYPGVRPEPAASVAGVLYRNLDAAALARLDAFEGEMYERVLVSVMPADGMAVDAWCYVIRTAYRDRLAKGEWDFETFLIHGKARFRTHYVGFSDIDKG